MNESTGAIKKLIAECSPEEQIALKEHLRSLIPHPLEKEWNLSSDLILDAIQRSNDITKRGVRGIIAEAVFEKSVLPGVEKEGWRAEVIVGDLSYDMHLVRGSESARIQIKLQRLVKGKPLLYYPKHYADTLYVVEVQKTRTGEKKPKKRKVEIGDKVAVLAEQEPASAKTRPYSFGDFDILAVNMHPSSNNWNDFRYTVGAWLLPKAKNTDEIETMQPVAAVPNDLWTSDLRECLEWLRSGEKRSVMTELLHRKPKERKARSSKSLQKTSKSASLFS